MTFGIRCFFAVLLPAASIAWADVITVNNPSFETVPAAEILACTGGPCTYFNNSSSASTVSGFVPGWTLDSFSEGGQLEPQGTLSDGSTITAQDGSWIAYLTNGSFFQEMGVTTVSNTLTP